MVRDREDFASQSSGTGWTQPGAIPQVLGIVQCLTLSDDPGRFSRKDGIRTACYALLSFNHSFVTKSGRSNAPLLPDSFFLLLAAHSFLRPCAREKHIDIIERSSGITDAEESAAEIQEKGEAMSEELGDRAGEAQSHWNIGYIYKETDNLAKAEEHISNTVQIAEQIGHPSLEEFRDGLARVRAAHQATSCG